MSDCEKNGHIWDGRVGRDFSCEKCGAPYSPPRPADDGRRARSMPANDELVERVAVLFEDCLRRHGVTNFEGTLDDALAALSTAEPLIRADERERWKEIETDPPPEAEQDITYFIVWGPHLPPGLVVPYEADRFWNARHESYPEHLSTKGFTHWRMIETPDIIHRIDPSLEGPSEDTQQ